MDDDRPDMAVLTAELTSEVTQLRASVRSLTAVMDSTQQRSRVAWRIGVVAVVGLALDLVLSLTMGYLLVQQADTNERLAAAQANQARTRAEVLCPLYKIFLESYDKARRDAMPPPAQKKYDDNFEVIRRGHQTLGCK